MAEQKRVEEAKIATAQQKARHAEAARRAALEKDTRYTRAMERYREMDRDGSARTLRDHYREAAIAANLNRGRTPSPPRSILGMGLDQDITTASISKITRHFVRDEFGLSANTAQHIGDGVALVAGAGLAFGQIRGLRGKPAANLSGSRVPMPGQGFRVQRRPQPIQSGLQVLLSKRQDASAASSDPVVRVVKRPHSAVMRGELKRTSAPYNPRQTLEDLHAVYPGRVTSSTVPAQHLSNVKLANTRHPVTGVEFNERGLPIFDPHAKVDLRIDRSVVQIKDSAAHMRAATRQLRENIETGKIDASQFTQPQLIEIQKGSARIPDLTWHHHQDVGRMQLVPRKIHRETPHVGGDHLWFQGEQL